MHINSIRKTLPTRAIVCIVSFVSVLGPQALAAHGETTQQVSIQGKYPGWLGINLRQVVREDESGSDVYIESLVSDGPAHRAGVRVGERLEEFNGVPAVRLLSDDPSLRPQVWAGDTVRLILGDSGGRREVVLVASRPPYFADLPWPTTLALDSLDGFMMPALDSLARLMIPALDSMARITVPELDSMARFMIPNLDSLTQIMYVEMDSLSRLLSPEAAMTLGSVLRATDTTLHGCDTIPCATTDPYYLFPGILDSVSVHLGAFSPLVPHALGQNRVAGAELADVAPQLGRYFGVESGVVVIDIGPGTPAARSGLAPGDVIVAADGALISSVDHFRRALAEAPRRGSTVTVVRRGDELELTIPR